jgi:hypothetical protein
MSQAVRAGKTEQTRQQIDFEEQRVELLHPHRRVGRRRRCRCLARCEKQELCCHREQELNVQVNNKANDVL